MDRAGYAPKYPVFRVRGRYMVEEWERYEPLIESVLAHDRYGFNVETLKKQLMVGAIEGIEVRGRKGPIALALVRSAVCWDQPALEVVSLAGQGFDRWGERLMDAVEVMARKVGAKRILVEGRRGWEKRLAALGFKTMQVVMTAEVKA